MTRGDARELAVHLIYSREFTGEDPRKIVDDRLDEDYYTHLAEENEIYSERPTARQAAYIQSVVAGIAAHMEELDHIISKYAIGWDVKRISRLSRAILQLAIYEICYEDDVPDGVAVSEAVRLAKKYDSEAGGFINGILGSVVRAKSTPAPAGEPAGETAAEAEAPAAVQTAAEDAAVTEEV